MAEQRIEKLILRGLATDDKFCRKVIPFLKQEYFENPAEGIVFRHVEELFLKYNSLPGKDALSVAMAEDKTIQEALYPKTKEIILELNALANVDEQWMLDNTEKFCKDRSVYNAILKSIDILDGKDKKLTKDALPQLLQDALAVGFDAHVGHDYFGDLGTRYEFYHEDRQRIPFKLKKFNEVTKGGVPRKTLNIFMAGTNVGKSMFMCDWAAFLVMQGYNVLYVTAEMAEMRIAERLDANLLGVKLDELYDLSKDMFETRLTKLKDRTNGQLIVKEYATSTAHVGHLHALMNELKIKKNFVPDLVFVDYLNIFCSQRFKVGTDSYTYVKATAEELRGFAVHHDVAVVSATQVNRAGYSNSDMDLDDTSESWGLPATADFFAALIHTEELHKLGQQLAKQLKSRYGNPNKDKRFVVGVDPDMQRYYDVDDHAQTVGQSAVIVAEKNKSNEAVMQEFFGNAGVKKPERIGAGPKRNTEGFKV